VWRGASTASLPLPGLNTVDVGPAVNQRARYRITLSVTDDVLIQ